jgi:hypothetical protein
LRLAAGAHIWPDNGRPELIGLSHHCIIGHDNPFAVEPHAIVPVPCIPIDVVNPEAVGEGAAQALFARELVEPGFQGRIGIPAIVTRGRNDLPANGCGKPMEVEPGADANDPTSSIAMSRTLRITRAAYIPSDLGISFGRASAKLGAARMAHMRSALRVRACAAISERVFAKAPAGDPFENLAAGRCSSPPVTGPHASWGIQTNELHGKPNKST